LKEIVSSGLVVKKKETANEGGRGASHLTIADSEIFLSSLRECGKVVFPERLWYFPLSNGLLHFPLFRIRIWNHLSALTTIG
jgi:hypothetical protein